MPIVTVVAKLIGNRDSVEAVKAELIKMIEPTRLEEGCIAYRLHQDNDDPSVFVFYETWQEYSGDVRCYFAMVGGQGQGVAGNGARAWLCVGRDAIRGAQGLGLPLGTP
jgi:Antibiotic biosynthesis monooxygenase